MQLMALGANSQGLWQSQLAAVAARQLSQSNERQGGLPQGLQPTGPPPPPPPPPAPPTPPALPPPSVSQNEIQAIQQALQQQQQNIQQHLQNLLLLQQSAGSLNMNTAAGGNAGTPSPPFLGNQVGFLIVVS
jgi:hypothetical protein